MHRTDPELPALLSVAASRVDRVGQQLVSMNASVLLARARAVFGWEGAKRADFELRLREVNKELLDEVRLASDLASTLRRASANASNRLEAEAAWRRELARRELVAKQQLLQQQQAQQASR